jgi:hypothetical protein
MVYILNEERQPYTLEENTKFFRRMYDQMGSVYAVAKAFKRTQSTIWNYINVSILPEHFQKAVWGRKIPMNAIKEMEPVFTQARDEIGDITSPVKYENSPSYQKILAWCERCHNVEATVKIETPEELERAAKTLQQEARRRAETLLTPEERAARQAEAQARAEDRARRTEERQQRQEEERRHLEEEAREKVTQELFENPTLLKQAAERLADLKRREREARLKDQQAPFLTPLTEADLVLKAARAQVEGGEYSPLPLLHRVAIADAPPYYS